jgi:hypothetical protein
LAGVVALTFAVGMPAVLPASVSATEAAGSAPAAPGSGIVVVHAKSRLDSDWIRSVGASCPPDTVIYGGGGRVTSGSGVVDLLQLQPGDPQANDNTYWVTAIESSPYSLTWRVHAFAICGPPLAGLERVVSASSSLPAGAVTTGATAVCPAGKVVLSTGALATIPGEAPLFWIRPTGNGTEVFAVIHRDDRVTPSSLASVTAIALCAPAPAGHEVIATGTQPTPQGLKSVYAWCRNGKTVLGGGVTMSDATGQGHHHFAGFVPDTVTRRYILAEAEGPGGTDWALGSWAICAEL